MARRRAAGVAARTGQPEDYFLPSLLANLAATLIWAGSFVLRAALMTPLYLSGQVLALGVVKVAPGWPMVLVVILASWVVIRRTLPDDHAGVFGYRTAVSEQP